MFRPFGVQTRVLYQDWLFVHLPWLFNTAPLLASCWPRLMGYRAKVLLQHNNRLVLTVICDISQFTFHILQVLSQHPSQWMTAPDCLTAPDPHNFCLALLLAIKNLSNYCFTFVLLRFTKHFPLNLVLKAEILTSDIVWCTHTQSYIQILLDRSWSLSLKLWLLNILVK